MNKSLFLLLIPPLITACASGPSKVDRLCAIDGGIRIYETVELPPDKFDQWGQINFYRPTQVENTLGSDYIYKRDIHYYQQGDPERQVIQETTQKSVMKRHHIKIVNKQDMKLLGEVVMYYKAEGNLPDPWNYSSYQCPDRSEVTEGMLLNAVFTKTTK